MARHAAIRIVCADDEAIARRGMTRLLDVVAGVELVAACRNGQEALRAIRATRPDIAFLDVAMPGCSGIDVVRALPPDERPIVVFITAYDRFAIDAFEVCAVDYLLKPFRDDRFHVALTRACERVTSRERGPSLPESLIDAFTRRAPDREFLITKEGDTMLFIPVDEIAWCEAADNYVRLHTQARRYLIRETMRGLERRLAPNGFARIHRSAIVNRVRVREVRPTPNGEYTVRLDDGTKLTMSRTHRDALLPARASESQEHPYRRADQLHSIERGTVGPDVAGDR